MLVLGFARKFEAIQISLSLYQPMSHLRLKYYQEKWRYTEKYY